MKQPRSGCPINAAVEALGDHWSLLVLRDVIFGDRPYFRELQAGSIEGIASNILVVRLKKTRHEARAFATAGQVLARTLLQRCPAAGARTGARSIKSLQMGSFGAVSKAVIRHRRIEGSNPSPSAW